MSCVCLHPVRGNRYPENCAKCGKSVPANPLPQQKVDEFFDGLQEALEAAGVLHRPNPGEPPDPFFAWFKTRCSQRLRQGALTYGPRNFLRPDIFPAREGIEEQQDAANYGLMLLVKDEPDDTDAAWLGVAVCKAFESAHAFHMYEMKKRGAAG